ncbi:DUF2336 domain-containing protein [Pedomonas mirosovicensis]|uniref:DUF2336 domain-containing protein n=1 Tax=Pedomonas mirosovicensis TaxID=2908641 RepID=UPI002167D1D9|nr:DUF2336 domain-containing protein [Pedomonas mirosovicensis]MCH8684210.1 DUF2336 domain-containing protein [Pedomonas mirosovicensis]
MRKPPFKGISAAIEPAQEQPTATRRSIRILTEGDEAARERLAADASTPPEVLYYLAERGSPQVRATVAANRAAPHLANRLLARDRTDAVRVQLARKVAHLLPEASQADNRRAQEHVTAVLEALAHDQAPRVRMILAEEIKSSAHVPHHVALKLAQDVELAVSGPMLACSPVLTEEDLLAIVATCPAPGARAAIAGRPQVSERLSHAIVQSADAAAVAALLANPNAQIREDTLDAILDAAPEQETWHQPLALRTELPVPAMRRIAGFVAAALVEQMIARHGVEPSVASDLLSRVQRRLDHAGALTEADDTAVQAAAVLHAGRFGDAWVRRMVVEGKLGLVTAVIGLAAEVGIPTAQRIMASGSAQAVMALCWAAQLSATTAEGMQQLVAKIPETERLTQTRGGLYPLPATQMAEILDSFHAA